MQTWIKLLLILFLCAAACGANDFSGDGNCVALYRLEDGSLTTDSKGTNTLTNVGVVSYTSGFKEGAACGDFDDSAGDYLYINDGALDSGFPGKSGEANATFSLSFWVYITLVPGSNNWDYIVSKWNSGTNKRSYAVSLHNNAGTSHFELLIGYGGGASADLYTHASAITSSRWYHIGVTWNDSTKAYVIRVWDDTAGSILGVDKTGTGSNQMNIEDAMFVIGDRADISGNLDGYLDEVVVFNDILTADEIDQIRSGTFGAAAPAAGGQVIIVEAE